MPNIPQPQRQDEPVVTDADLAALLAGTTDVAPGLRPVADILAALTAEATGTELAGEARALTEFRRRTGVPVPARRAGRGTAGLTSRLGFKVGASVTAVAVVLGGGAAAAFANVLPAPIQRLAHEAIGAPIPGPQHGLPRHSRSAAHGRAANGQTPAHGKSAARGGPGAKRQAHPHATPSPTAQGNPNAQGKHGNPQGKGPHGQGGGQGHQGDGQGNGNGKGHGQSNGHKRGSSQGQGHGNGSGKGQAREQGPGVRPPGPGHHGNPYEKGPHGSPQPNRRPAWHPRWPVRGRRVMNP